MYLIFSDHSTQTDVRSLQIIHQSKLNSLSLVGVDSWKFRYDRNPEHSLLAEACRALGHNEVKGFLKDHWWQSYEYTKILCNLCLHFRRQDGQDRKKWKKNHETKVTRIQKPKDENMAWTKHISTHQICSRDLFKWGVQVMCLREFDGEISSRYFFREICSNDLFKRFG